MMDWLAFWLPLVSVLVIALAIASLVTLGVDACSEREKKEEGYEMESVLDGHGIALDAY